MYSQQGIGNSGKNVRRFIVWNCDPLFYARFMDDWVVIAPTRWKLRSAVRIVNETLNVLKVEKNPSKTFIGKVERGFDCLGHLMKPGVLRVSIGTFKRFTKHISQLYEQGADNLRIYT